MTAQILDKDGNSVKAYGALADAVAAAQDGQTVTLLADAAEDVVISKSITLDLGGKTLTNTNAGKATISVKSGTVTVKNGNVVGGNDYYNIEAKKDANLTLTDVTATAGNTGSSMIDNYGTLTITSGTYNGGLDTVKNEPSAKLTITGGTFTLTKGTSKGFTGVVFNYGELTISGGEPLLQLDFVSEVFRLARAKKVQTALDTSAQPFAPDNAEWMARFDRLLENTDLVILDLKEIDDEKHKKLTGHSNKNILAMAQYVAARGVDLWVRHVLVPGLTDDADGLRQLDAFIKTLPTVRRVEILPYHTLGLFKWQNLGIPYPLDGVRVPTAEEVETAEQLLHVRDYPDAPKGSTTK